MVTWELGEAAGPPIYPDLVTPDPAGLFISRDVMADGKQHYLLKFDNTIANYGGRLEITANLAVNRDIYQAVYDELVGGNRVLNRRVGSDLIFHPQHNHFHFADFGSYVVLKKNNAGRYQPTTKRGTKTSFCIIDYVRMSSGAVIDPEYAYCNDRIQGLSHGWGDLYYSSLPEQWVDLGTTMLPEGDYALQSTANPAFKIYESDYSNNVGTTYFTIRNGEMTSASQSPSCSVSPNSAKVGDTVNLSCTRLDQNVEVDVRWGSTSGPVIATAVTDPEYKMLTSFQIPPGELGAHPIFVLPAFDSGVFGTTITILPSVSVESASTVAGSSIRVIATGYSGFESVAISIGGVSAGNLAADVNGVATGEVTTPSLGNGPHALVATGGTSGASASTSVQIGAKLVLDPGTASQQQSVQVGLQGFAADETVEVSIAGTVLLSTVVNENGESSPGAANAFVVPDTLPPGETLVRARGTRSGVSTESPLLVLAANEPSPTASASATATPTGFRDRYSDSIADIDTQGNSDNHTDTETEGAFGWRHRLSRWLSQSTQRSGHQLSGPRTPDVGDSASCYRTWPAI